MAKALRQHCAWFSRNIAKGVSWKAKSKFKETNLEGQAPITWGLGQGQEFRIHSKRIASLSAQ